MFEFVDFWITELFWIPLYNGIQIQKIIPGNTFCLEFGSTHKFTTVVLVRLLNIALVVLNTLRDELFVILTDTTD